MFGSMTQAIQIPTTRRHFSKWLAAATAGAATATESATALASPSADPIFALIARHRAEEQAYGDALKARDELHEILPDELRRTGRVQWGMRAPGRPNYLHSHEEIDDCLVAGSRHSPKIKARLHAELDRDRIELAAKREEIDLTAAEDRAEQLCDSCYELEWALANTMRHPLPASRHCFGMPMSARTKGRGVA